MTRRENSRRRNAPVRRDRDRILVICGGKRTEPTYIDGLKQKFRNAAVRVKVVEDGRDPATMIRAAPRRLANLDEDYEQVWCVFDVDEFDIALAAEEARRNGSKLAVSNPCFEVWLLMHYQHVTAFFSSASAARTALTRRVPGYDKTDLRFEDFTEGVDRASTRARSSQPTDDPGPNPSSGMWRLVEVIRGS